MLRSFYSVIDLFCSLFGFLNCGVGLLLANVGFVVW